MRQSRRRGFTLIELLVVIGIILILVSIVVMGLRHLNYTAARHETIAEFKICEDMLNEYKNINGLTNIENSGGGQLPASGGTAPWGTATIYLPPFADSNTEVTDNGQLNSTQNKPITALVPGDFSYAGTSDMGSKIDPARWLAPAVSYTQAIMYVVLRDSKNRTTIAGVPTKRILEAQPATVMNAPTGSFNAADYSVVLDGWGSPIVYVPRGGMHVFSKPAGTQTTQDYVVRSSGVFLGPNNLPPLSAADHPFFASAGQDGNFTDSQSTGNDYAIDNMYSFRDQ